MHQKTWEPLAYIIPPHLVTQPWKFSWVFSWIGMTWIQGPSFRGSGDMSLLLLDKEDTISFIHPIFCDKSNVQLYKIRGNIIVENLWGPMMQGAVCLAKFKYCPDVDDKQGVFLSHCRAQSALQYMYEFSEIKISETESSKILLLMYCWLLKVCLLPLPCFSHSFLRIWNNALEFSSQEHLILDFLVCSQHAETHFQQTRFSVCEQVRKPLRFGVR